jgi:branched-chain amino acid transport system permease protein
MDWLFFGEISLADLAMGGLYAFIALGFVIIYKAIRVINFAIGEIMMFAAYLFLAFAGGKNLSPTEIENTIKASRANTCPR